MIWVEPGTFTMGQGDISGYAAHQVTLTRGFYLGKYEVTQAQYEAVMTGNVEWLECHTESVWRNNPIVQWKKSRTMTYKFFFRD